MSTGTEIMPAGPAQQQLQFDVHDLNFMAEMAGRSGLIKGVNTPQAAFTLMLVCQARNEHPGNAIMRYHIIEGMPSMKAEAMLAEFQARGGRLSWVENSDDVVEAEFSHPKLHPKPVRVRAEMAKLKESGVAYGWNKRTNKEELKDTYRKYPGAMLRARVVSQGVKMIDPGAILGTYTPEEISDFIDVTPTSTGLRPPEIEARAQEEEAEWAEQQQRAAGRKPAELPSTRGEVNEAFKPAQTQDGKIVREQVKLNGDRYGIVNGQAGYDVRAWHKVTEQELGTANAAVNVKRNELGLESRDDAAANPFQIANKMFDLAIEEGLIDDPGDRKGLKPGQKVATLARAYIQDETKRNWMRRTLKRRLLEKYDEAVQIAENEAHGDAPGHDENASQAPAVEPEDAPQATPTENPPGKGDGYDGP